MAMISKNQITKIEKERNSIHSKVKATYTIFTYDGEKYFQIDTYGKASREYTDKISQSIQLDKDSAKTICELLKKTFDL